ncbi:MAG: hypothetical protein FWD76_03800 [Firmicutes bacterium]|nr:hypothetical protein [Bacillota bacterium]
MLEFKNDKLAYCNSCKNAYFVRRVDFYAQQEKTGENWKCQNCLKKSKENRDAKNE